MTAALAWTPDTRHDAALERSLRAAGVWDIRQRPPETKIAAGRLGQWTVSNDVTTDRTIRLTLTDADLWPRELATFEDRDIAKAAAAMLDDAEAPPEPDLAAAGFEPYIERTLKRVAGRNYFTLTRDPDFAWLTYQTGAKRWHNVAILGGADMTKSFGLGPRFDAVALMAAEMFLATLRAKRARRSKRQA